MQDKVMQRAEAKRKEAETEIENAIMQVTEQEKRKEDIKTKL